MSAQCELTPDGFCKRYIQSGIRCDEGCEGPVVTDGTETPYVSTEIRRDCEASTDGTCYFYRSTNGAKRCPGLCNFRATIG